MIEFVLIAQLGTLSTQTFLGFEVNPQFQTDTQLATVLTNITNKDSEVSEFIYEDDSVYSLRFNYEADCQNQQFILRSHTVYYPEHGEGNWNFRQTV